MVCAKPDPGRTGLLQLGAVALGLWLSIADPARAQRPTDCPVQGRETQPYRNTRWGVSLMRHPGFVLDPGSVTPNGDSVRFWTADRRATAVVTSLRQRADQSILDLLAEARQDILVNSRGEITYQRRRDNWFVLSGYVAGRIFYQRTFLARDRQATSTLLVEFPRDMLPCFDRAVTTMSLSFREWP
ncbi:hypothetical protein DOO78_18410 [Roseicella frigidaeris]|uniref:Uncharacterized protein n=2 Tax=Roseicella frigidaeris TaxID=2230885 RepID=A0A327M502_9PROT|nr:hypothetical protein DOO78_18410 [Roseicella frigidaeris]